MDCHVDSFAEEMAGGGLKYRACAVHTATGGVLYTTWPYTRQQSAVARARRWLREEYQKLDGGGLFDAKDGVR